MENTLLDPRNDFVFKRLFANELPLLTDLINAVRIGEPMVTVVNVINPRIEAEELHGKFIILDILAKDQDGHFYNIEMQMSRQQEWSARSMYYLAKTLSGQLKAGEQYDGIKPVIGIHLLGYDLFEETEQAVWHFEMRDRFTPRVRLGNELQLNIVELPKADRLASVGQQHVTGLSALTAWITYFQHCNEDNIMNQIAYPPVLQAMQQLKVLSSDEEARRLADVRERALIAERTEIAAAEARGLAQALQLMIQSGMTEAQARAILQL